MFAGSPPCLSAQHVPTTSAGSAAPDRSSIASSTVLPDAPMPAAVQGTASISGVVQDITGATVAAAQVTLTGEDGAPRGTLSSGANGEFTFSQLPPGSYRVMINAGGLQPFQSGEIVVTAEQAYRMPGILLPVATANSEVTVRPTEVIAAEQIKAQEKQRILGIVPNFYTSFVYDAVPLNTRQKYSLAFRDTFDPVRFVGAGIAAGIQQANNSYAGYGQGAAGYGKRYAAAYGNGLTQDILSHAVFPSLFHQDPRYFYQGSGTTRSRLEHAISFAVITRSDSGGTMPNYSYLLGDLGSGLLSNLYYPHANRGVGLVFSNAAIGIAGRAGGNIIREFLAKRVTTNVPANGKP